MQRRIKYVFQDNVWTTDKLKTPFQHNMTMVKGSVHVLLSKAFVDFVVQNPLAREFRTWCRDTAHGSEHFYNSLQYSPQLDVPGSYTSKYVMHLDIETVITVN